ncbi:MAG: sulfotransferase family protein [Gammaproteobacteria bacterium]
MRSQRIFVWSGPRNISTALMYSFAQRDDTQVVDEPLYAHYLHVTGANHPGREEVIASQDNDGVKVLEKLLGDPLEKPLLFAKQMAHHLASIEPDQLDEASNVLLIRDPREMLPSLAEVLGKVRLEDTGLTQQVALVRHLEKKGYEPFCIDSRELLLAPEEILRKICERLEIPFDDRMLSWSPGPRPEDGVWAPHWYSGVHRSSGFQPWKASARILPAGLEPLLSECRELYDFLYQRAIR